MKSSLNAIRSYFEEKNRAWVTGEMEALVNVSRGKSGASWWQVTGESIQSKLREMSHRNSRVLRAHTHIYVHPSTKVQKADLEDALIEEHVTWVYRDGSDYGVESRIIQHHQQWLRQDGVWRLGKALESSERQALWPASGLEATPMEASVASTRHASHPAPYDRLRTLRFAELWWNGWNAAYPRLSDDCTNFVSQCLYAGRMPIRGGESRSAGWWYRFGVKGGEPWSYSWTTSHALYIYLTSKMGASVMKSPRDLKIGDLVFYDWDGSGKYHHTTLVTDFDHKGDPLVNAHSDASYHRHYRYLDSRAWTANTHYQFVHMPEVFY